MRLVVDIQRPDGTFRTLGTLDTQADAGRTIARREAEPPIELVVSGRITWGDLSGIRSSDLDALGRLMLADRASTFRLTPVNASGSFPPHVGLYSVDTLDDRDGQVRICLAAAAATKPVGALSTGAGSEADLDALAALVDEAIRAELRRFTTDAAKAPPAVAVRRFEAIISGALTSACRLLWLTRREGAGVEETATDLLGLVRVCFQKLEAATPANEDQES